MPKLGAGPVVNKQAGSFLLYPWLFLSFESVRNVLRKGVGILLRRACVPKLGIKIHWVFYKFEYKDSGPPIIRKKVKLNQGIS